MARGGAAGIDGRPLARTNRPSPFGVVPCFCLVRRRQRQSGTRDSLNSPGEGMDGWMMGG
ncbi:uncharacterized protein GLRG_06390 [Colletotrichum graminicola M1.001]|uniref:Uncharacterized protein n=1 Tax=Colletotrichum graminicola (strain M1.001 / M2 / FGSC 10212) TaxID=645133 RepID=E3QK58_COLGM|nr:uncharacterized protein GLRG_06390 [Colletotrichum graminicola M1.001]EFQ31246.1 hypothetical protein GLRG_06390 [Colletotrichum graminicola M1.001]